MFGAEGAERYGARDHQLVFLSGTSLLFWQRADRLKAAARTTSSTAAGGKAASYAARLFYCFGPDIVRAHQDRNDEPVSPEIRDLRLLRHADEFPDGRSGAGSLSC